MSDDQQTDQQWWHVLGGEVPDMSVDDDGNLSPAWGAFTVGPTTRGADEGIRSMTMPLPRGGEARYLGTFDHEPSDAEKDALAPEEYRDGDTVAHEQFTT